MSILKQFAAALVFLTAVSHLAIAQAPGAKLQGVWKVVEVKSTGPDAATNSKPQPGLWIYTAKHYSFTRVLGEAPRPDLPADASKATAAELQAAWGPFAAAAGTYEVVGDKLTTYPIVAKAPANMASGAKLVASFKLEGNTLWLTPLTNPAGPVANPATVKLTRAE